MKEKLLNALKKIYRSYIWLGVLLLVIDIITKQIIMHSGIEPNSGKLVANWGFVHINYILNPNAAFGIGVSNEDLSRAIYLIVATLISAGIITYLVMKRKETKLYVRACLILVITGAVGNMIDRIFYGPLQGAKSPLFSGMVVDWIDFYWFWGYIFNIADCCIVIAAFMLIIYIIVSEVKEMLERRKAENVEIKTLSKTEQERLDEQNKNRENKDNLE